MEGETSGPFHPMDPPVTKMIRAVPGETVPVPGDDILADFNRAHNSVIGHEGVKVTIQNMVRLGRAAKDIRARVTDLVRSCAVCQKTRLGKHGFVPTIRTTAVMEPFTHIEWDTMGPYKPDSQGYKYILAIQDRFTRYLELRPTKDALAISAAKELLAVCARYGVPETLHSDQGTQFTALVINHLCAMLRITQTFGPPYRPQAQGSIERSNAETARHLRALLVGVMDMVDWSDQLPLVQRTYNSLANRSTGVAPAQLLYGGAIDLNRMLLTAPAPPQADVTTYHQYLQNLLAGQEAMVASARAHQQKVVDARLAKAPPNPTFFEVGTMVLVLPKGQDMPKHDVRWLGPYVVVNHIHESYLCQDLNTHKVHQFTADRMQVYREDIQVPAPKVALWGHREYEVENILSHALGATAAKSTFKVRWAGFGPEDDSVLQYKFVKNLACFRRYMRDNDLPERLFPRDKLPLIE